ncbi:MAG: cytochrome c [Euryarchaeota archaeon]|nr:cytochrome c [Euryarchaeota archaeon]
MGCASCHGMDGKGGLPGVGAPDIRGASEARVRGALAGGVPLMSSFIKLNDEEVTAVVAYLKYLNERS